MSEDKIIEKVLQECKIDYSGDKDKEMTLQSVQLVSLIVALEEEFDIEVPDEYMVFEALNTYHKIENMLREVRV